MSYGVDFAKPRAAHVACTAVACHISESVTLGHIRSHSCRDVLVYCRDVYQAPVKFVMAINLKATKSLGLTVPQILLVAADEVIE